MSVVARIKGRSIQAGNSGAEGEDVGGLVDVVGDSVGLGVGVGLMVRVGEGVGGGLGVDGVKLGVGLGACIELSEVGVEVVESE